MFEKLPKGGDTLELKETVDVCVDLHWFMQRYPLLISTEDMERLNSTVAGYREEIVRVEDMLNGQHVAREFPMRLPPRDYQQTGAEVWLAKGGLLLADSLGLGKTVTAICGITDPRAQPAVIVCPPALRIHWKEQLEKFVPQLQVHLIKSSTPYKIGTVGGRMPDVYVIGYTGVQGWSEVLSRTCSSVVFDEAHELRRTESQKYRACKSLARKMEYRLGMSATPIANYGGEIFNVMDVLKPGCFGEYAEFLREWCPGAQAHKPVVRNAEALGAWLRREQLMLRRTKQDVGRELPELTRVTHYIDADQAAINSVKGQATELAELILNANARSLSKAEQMNAMGQMSTLLRQATGVAKAPYVAAFVEMLLEAGEKVLLFGWHRSVYSIWMQKLIKHRPALYTGSESPEAKEAAKRKFVEGKTDLLIMSLRSGGQGVDGLQHVCKTAVIGELDWTDSVIEQCLGRLHRDGQQDQVTGYILLSNAGIDPDIAEILGIKRQQLKGIQGESRVLQKAVDTGLAIRKAAERYMERKGRL